MLTYDGVIKTFSFHRKLYLFRVYRGVTFSSVRTVPLYLGVEDVSHNRWSTSEVYSSFSFEMRGPFFDYLEVRLLLNYLEVSVGV